MLARRRTIIFLVRGSKLRVSCVENVVRDFYEDKKEDGRYFSFCELRELVEVIRDPNYFLKSSLFGELVNYALPFFEKESLKRKTFYDWYALDEINNGAEENHSARKKYNGKK